MTARVEIYATSFCRHCVATREFLDRKQIEYTEYLLDLMPLERDTMIRRCNQQSVPQIFINDRHIGGFDELLQLDSRAELDRMIREG